MRKGEISKVFRFLALSLSFALSAPSSVFALRNVGLEESKDEKEKFVAALTAPADPPRSSEKMDRRAALKTIGLMGAAAVLPGGSLQAQQPVNQDQIDRTLTSLSLERKVALLQSMGWLGTKPLVDERARHLLIKEGVGIFTLYDYNLLGTAAQTGGCPVFS